MKKEKMYGKRKKGVRERKKGIRNGRRCKEREGSC